MFNNINQSLQEASRRERELTNLLAIAIKKLGGTLEIEIEDMEKIQYSSANIYTYINEKTGGKIYKV